MRANKAELSALSGLHSKYRLAPKMISPLQKAFWGAIHPLIDFLAAQTVTYPGASCGTETGRQWIAFTHFITHRTADQAANQAL